nr:immunoglobulin light chain junction region [Macaca mulatta]MOW05550.1 immunoglobulin light chain junction region [Macaca mulatta]MOY06186.1 immunoglobulin light chain junction region [Macaca mulatta]
DYFCEAWDNSLSGPVF